MPLNPRCLTCGKNAPHWKYRPFCSEQCNPEKKTKKAPAKPDTKKENDNA